MLPHQVKLAAIIIALYPCVATAEAEGTKLPPRCAHAIGSATLTFGHLVSDQLLELDGVQGVQPAHDALELTTQLQCSKSMVLDSVDCIVQHVHSTSKRPDVTDVLRCVKQATGATLFDKK